MAKILVVDDEAALRHTLCAILEKAGHEVFEAADGDECLQQFKTDPPDLLLIDLVMPGREGVETVTELRRLGATIPIVAMSGGGSTGEGGLFLDIAMHLGATCSLPKPIRREVLVETVKVCLGVGVLAD